MALTYTTWVSQLSNLMVVSSTNAEFQTFLPGCIDYAEQRLYRELDLLVTRVTDATQAFAANSRALTLPTGTGTFLVVEQVSAITPAGTPATTGTRNPLTATSRDYIDWTYPTAGSSVNSVPKFFAMQNNTTLVVGPAPDAAYIAEIVGTQRPTALSSTNTTTFLTNVLPDLFMAASMVFATGYQRDFGAQADNPQMGAAWEAQYKLLLESANVEELRKRYFGPAWTDKTPSAIATPARV